MEAYNKRERKAAFNRIAKRYKANCGLRLRLSEAESAGRDESVVAYLHAGSCPVGITEIELWWNDDTKQYRLGDVRELVENFNIVNGEGATR